MSPVTRPLLRYYGGKCRMKREIQTTVVECYDDEPGVYHIPGCGNMQNTLCGFVDVQNEHYHFDGRPVTCVACIAILKRIQALRFPKGYFGSADAANRQRKGGIR